ncbi:hypothetical protein BC830DRAFT_579110 [Chytriomyces sp. MP71]|nr:hypothetical protein BC830DRAFT_579110 [Chytriomyces sp. MP71]
MHRMSPTLFAVLMTPKSQQGMTLWYCSPFLVPFSASTLAQRFPSAFMVCRHPNMDSSRMYLSTTCRILLALCFRSCQGCHDSCHLDFLDLLIAFVTLLLFHSSCSSTHLHFNWVLSTSAANLQRGYHGSGVCNPLPLPCQASSLPVVCNSMEQWLFWLCLAIPC